MNTQKNAVSNSNFLMGYHVISAIFQQILLNCVNFWHFFIDLLGGKKQLALYLQWFSWY